MPSPDLEVQPRVAHDIDDLLDFIARQPWGNRAARERDIWQGVAEILAGPQLDDVSVRRREPAIELRRHNAAQFAIIYAYTPPGDNCLNGLVSVRAIRHGAIKHVFKGVREVARCAYTPH